MKCRALLPVLVLAACAGRSADNDVTAARGAPRVLVSAAVVPDGMRVYLRHTRGDTGGHLARLRVEGGTLADRVDAPDGLGVAVTWRAPAGRLHASFAYGAQITVAAHALPVRDGATRYELLRTDAFVLQATVARGTPLSGDLHCRLVGARGTLQLGVATVDVGAAPVPLPLPRAKQTRLRGGDHVLRLVVGETTWRVRVAIDPDGVVAALQGRVVDW